MTVAVSSARDLQVVPPKGFALKGDSCRWCHMLLIGIVQDVFACRRLFSRSS